jgi:hypothetical protein
MFDMPLALVLALVLVLALALALALVLVADHTFAAYNIHLLTQRSTTNPARSITD